MADLLTHLNTCGFTVEFKKLSDLEIDKPYKTSNYKIVNTKFGDKLSVVLDEKFQIILPDRFMDVVRNNEDLDNLNWKNYNLVYKGKKPLDGGRFVHEIKFE